MSDALVKSIGKALSVIVNAGFATFGRWPSAGRNEAEQTVMKRQIHEIAQVYAVAISDDIRITAEIVEATAKRYIKGKVTVWVKESHVPAKQELPTAPEFRDACIQTWDSMFTQLAIGESVCSLGYVTTHMITLPKSLSKVEIQMAINEAKLRIGIQEAKPLPLPSKSTPTLAMVERSLSIHAVRPIEQSETEAAERRKLLRKQAESVGRTG